MSTQRSWLERRDPLVVGVLLALVGACAVGAAPQRAVAQDRAVSERSDALRYGVVDLKALERTFVSLADEERPSVVAIRTYRAIDPGGTGTRFILRPESQGSGFIIAGDGFVATNRHVLEEADVVTAILYNGLKYEAEVVQTDPRSDLAVIKIDETGLKPVRLGDYHAVRVGHWVFACGNPFGLANDGGGPSVTFGLVSALGRQMTHRLVGFDSQVRYYGNMIETSASINPGSSGGPLFNLDGEVVGVVTAIETASGVSEGAGFAIPIDANTRRILESLKAGKEVRYGFLGVTVQNVARPSSPLVAESTAYYGAELATVEPPDGPAARAGLRPKDIIVEYNGTKVRDSDHLVRLVGFTQVGATVPVVYLRQGVRRNASVVLGDRLEILSPHVPSE